jgi:asparagine synthase (glutamine-hydrolysing)
MRSLADDYLSKQAIEAARLLDNAAVQQVLQQHGDSDTSDSERTKLDAIINHMLSVQMLHEHFVAKDVPKQACDRARELGWYAQQPTLANA